MPLLEAEQCSISLAGKRIVEAASFRVEAGTCVGLIGPNGSGKTTLLRAIGGMLPYDGGLAFEDRPVRDWPVRALARRLAFVRQAPSLSFDLRVEDLVALGRAPHKRLLEGRTATDHTRIRKALRAVELEGFEERSALSLSGGELQRVFLAQALAQEADFLLLDEPTAHLDVHYQYTFLERVRWLVEEEERTALTALHDLERAARYTDRLLVLGPDGRLAADGPPNDVLTPDLIASVFRMKARVDAGADGPLRIRYLAPVRGERAANVA